MSYILSDRCLWCATCLPYCPNNAIEIENGQVWIDPERCDNCQGTTPQCVIHCPVNSPIPDRTKKGRNKAIPYTSEISDLFQGKSIMSFASSLVVWEGCNILAQRSSLPWQLTEDGERTYKRSVSRDRGKLEFYLTDDPGITPDANRRLFPGLQALESIDLRSACLHLLYATCAATLDRPWENSFTLSDRQIEMSLGLDKRRDLSRAEKLALIKELARQPSRLEVEIDWPAQGKIPAFSVARHSLWELEETQHYFQEDETGTQHLIGLTFTVRAGRWSSFFLNREQARRQQAFYQCGSLPQPLLAFVTSQWHRHEGAVRIALWLLFKTRLGKRQRLTVQTLMKVAYGIDRLQNANRDSGDRKRLIRTFENDLSALVDCGFQLSFDPVSYPLEIQPFWARASDLPDDAEAALEFWTNDGSGNHSITDSAPRGKWNRLKNACFSSVKLPPAWVPSSRTKQKLTDTETVDRSKDELSGQQIAQARRLQGFSQRQLAAKVGKSQSWVRDIENGRLRIKPEDRQLLCEILQIDT
ncbi:MAG: helix-turn-helix domain-containing protein [Cyanobacteria bacterium SID2]|nr:helix-turn-helix domain-containing protein [Cyanobacteria bacterium SID2]MBP0006489.1 helix-turn-helix domain-containing protein [Cyanobacteria bacterium SBC]